MDREQVTELKNKAEKFAQAGKWKKALEVFEQLREADPRNDRVMRRIGDVYFRMGDTIQAKESYKKLANLYARNGFWAKAISTNKLILELDPNDHKVQNEIVTLYSNMGIQSKGPKGSAAAGETSEDQPADTSQRANVPSVIAHLPTHYVDPSAIGAGTDNEAIELQSEVSTDNAINANNMDMYSVCISLEDTEVKSKPNITAAPPPPNVKKPSQKVQPTQHLDFSTVPPPDALLNDIIDLDEEVIQLEDVAFPKERIRVPLFSDFGPQELMQVLQHLSVRKMPANSIVCSVGQRGDSMYIIASGQVEVGIKDEKSNLVPVATLTSGEFFGEFGLLSDGKRHATVTTKTPTELLEITKADFRAIAAKYPQALKVLDQYYRRRLVDTVIRQNQLFKELKPEERQAFVSRFEFRKIPADAYLFKEGDEGGDLYFIKSGTFEVSIKRVSDVIVIAHLGPADFFGEMSLVTGQRRTATIRAEQAGEVLFLAKKHAEAIMHSSPTIRAKLEKYVVTRAEDSLAAYKSHQELKKEFALV